MVAVSANTWPAPCHVSVEIHASSFNGHPRAVLQISEDSQQKMDSVFRFDSGSMTKAIRAGAENQAEAL